MELIELIGLGIAIVGLIICIFAGIGIYMDFIKEIKNVLKTKKESCLDKEEVED
jgi:hypothetical protein